MTRRRRLPTAKPSDLPDGPGFYWWTEWNARVEVYTKPRSKKLWVTPPGPTPVEIPISPFIAGRFIKDTGGSTNAV